MKYLRMLPGIIVSTAFIFSPAQAQDWSTTIEGGVFSSTRTSTQNPIADSPFTGGYVAAYTSGNFGNFSVSFDGRLEFMDDQGIDDTYQTGPVHAGVFGVHVGREMPSGYVGAFAGVGRFDGRDSDSPMSGQIVGIEGSRDISSNFSVFGQLAHATAIGHPGDNEFVGYVAKIGVRGRLSDNVTGSVSYETGRSEDCFVDCGDEPGEYFGLSLDVAYELTSSVSIVGGLSNLRIEDYDDPDTGTDQTIFVGLRLNLGPKSGKMPLSTPIGVFRAAGWTEPLD